MKEDIIEAIMALIIVAILIVLVVGASGSPAKPVIDKHRRTLPFLQSKPHAEELLLKRQGQWT